MGGTQPAPNPNSRKLLPPAMASCSVLDKFASSIAPASKLCGASYFTDASIFAKNGSPAIVFGPGGIAQAHTKDEWIDLSQLAPVSEICYRFLESL